MKVKKLSKNILLFKAENQYQLTSTFMRMQEFYESSIPSIRNKFFTLETFMDEYANEFGNFTYCKDWAGFNVPGNIVVKFFKLFSDDLLEKEAEFYNQIIENVDIKKKFYIIGANADDDTLKHELCHAMYYIDSTYRNKVNKILKTTFTKKVRDSMYAWLKKSGYTKQVYVDEMNAYLSTSSMVGLAKRLKNENLPWKDIFVLQKLAATNIKKHIKKKH